jgi:hypothetical protein
LLFGVERQLVLTAEWDDHLCRKRIMIEIPQGL